MDRDEREYLDVGTISDTRAQKADVRVCQRHHEREGVSETSEDSERIGDITRRELQTSREST